MEKITSREEMKREFRRGQKHRKHYEGGGTWRGGGGGQGGRWLSKAR